MSARIGRVRWSKRYSFWSEWETLSKYWPGPGVYVIFRRRPIRRLSGLDRAGVLYVGKSNGLARRLKQFVACRHPASDFLCYHLPMARQLLSRTLGSVRDVERALDHLLVRVATPIPTRDLDAAEQAVLFAYLYRYGEMPPLNSLCANMSETPTPFEFSVEGGEERANGSHA